VRFLFSHFFIGEAKSFLLNCKRNDHDTIEIGEDEFARSNQNVAAADRHVVGHHPATSLAVDRSNAGVEYREFDCHDLSAIADESIADATSGAISLATLLINSPQGAFVQLTSLE